MSDLRDEFSKIVLDKVLSEFKITVRAGNIDALKGLTESVSALANGTPTKIDENTLTSTVSVNKASPLNVALKLTSKLKECFIIKLLEDKLEVEKIECPPCEEGAFTKMPDKYFLLEDGRVVEKRDANVYLVYVCRFKKSQ